MVRDPAERERRPERRGRDKCGRNKDRNGRKERTVRREARGGGGAGVAFLHIPSCPRVFLDGRGPAEREGRWRVEERREMERKGRGRSGFCLLPTFQSQS